MHEDPHQPMAYKRSAREYDFGPSSTLPQTPQIHPTCSRRHSVPSPPIPTDYFLCYYTVENDKIKMIKSNDVNSFEYYVVSQVTQYKLVLISCQFVNVLYCRY